MLRTIFGKKENEPDSSTMASAGSITDVEFRNALSRYPALIKKFSDNGKRPEHSRIESKIKNTNVSVETPTNPDLLQLDHFRYTDAPAAFSKQTGRTMKLEDVKMLVAWKL